MQKEKQHPKGFFVEMGLAIGIPIGIPIGLALGNIAYGPIIGLILGLGFGAAMEKKLNKNPRELTEYEKTKKKRMALFGIIAGAVFFVGGLLVYFIIK